MAPVDGMLEGDGRTWSKGFPGFDLTQVGVDLMDVAKFAANPRTSKQQQISGTSNAAEKQRDILKEDPYDLHAINELGLVYYREGRFKQCINVLIRGWKRMAEIEDEEVRFSFLMTLADASIKVGQYRQANAVMQDIAEPPKDKRRDRLLYSALAMKVFVSSGDIQKALKRFQVVLEDEEFDTASRMFIFVQNEFHRAGAYDSVKDAIMATAKTEMDKEKVNFAASIVEKQSTANNKRDRERKLIVAAITVVSSSVLMLGLCAATYARQYLTA